MKSSCLKAGQAEHLLQEMYISAENSANSFINFHVIVFLLVLIFPYSFLFTKLNLYLLLILSCLRPQL